jgi:NADH-quinone oxidoreductase subunit J
MAFQDLVFYIFSFMLVGAATMVIVARNPVYAVLFLICAFFNAAGLFVLMGAEFLAMVLVVVYVGAVAVLFLFVVMMLEPAAQSLKEKFVEYLPLGLLIGGILFGELLFFLIGSFFRSSLPPSTEMLGQKLSLWPESSLSNTQQIGQVLYTDYGVLFEVAGLILLVAMISAIVLTLRERSGVRRQRIQNQLERSVKDTLELKDVPTGKGI